jgi:hypothetical protein
MADMNFPTLESYIFWRTVKRAEYVVLTDDIRLLKTKRREIMKARGDAAETQQSLVIKRTEAREMMEARQEAKVIARDSWTRWRGANQAAA